MTDERDDAHDEDAFDDADELDELVGPPPGLGAGGFLLGVLVGTVLGAGIGLLMAPETGTDTRHRLSRGVRRFTADAKEHVGEWADDARRELRRRRRRLRRRLPRR